MLEGWKGGKEGIKNDTNAVLISLDQTKSFDRADYRFLAAIFETAGFEPELNKWISMQYHNLLAVLLVNGNHSESFAIKRSVQQGCPQSPLLYVCKLRDGGKSGSARSSLR